MEISKENVEKMVFRPPSNPGPCRWIIETGRQDTQPRNTRQVTQSWNPQAGVYRQYEGDDSGTSESKEKEKVKWKENRTSDTRSNEKRAENTKDSKDLKEEKGKQRKETIALEWVKTKVGSLIPYVFLSAPARKNVHNQTIIFSHGNASNLGTIFSFLVYLRERLNVNVVGYDYSGYGKSVCTFPPSERSVYADIEAIMKEMRARNIRYQDMILFGFSLGSAPTLHAATQYPVAGVVLEGAFLSCLDVALPQCSIPPHLARVNVFVNKEMIPHVACPIFIMHGVEDEVVDVVHGYVLESLTQTVTWTYYASATHNDVLLSDPSTYVSKLLSFLAHVALASCIAVPAVSAQKNWCHSY